MWKWESIKPGTRVRPFASNTSAPGGTLTASRLPTATIRSPRTTTTESETTGPPVPSISVAPTMAITDVSGGCATLFTSRSDCALARAQRITMSTVEKKIFMKLYLHEITLLCATSVFSVSLWLLFTAVSNHRDTENTDVAQRNQLHALTTGEHSQPQPS